MYQIYVDNNLIYDSTLTDYNISSGNLDLEINKSGCLKFGLYNNSPGYNTIERHKSIVVVKEDNDIIFRGRVITSQDGFYNDRVFTCEGELSFFLDSIVRPYEFNGTPKDLLKKFIDNHNAQVDASKKIKLGSVTVTDPNNYIVRSNSNYEDTLKNINEKLIDMLGGYLIITRESDGSPILNWLVDSSEVSNQVIEFGENLLDYVKTNDVTTVATVLIPLGKRNDTTKKRLTIESVNGGKDYIYNQDAVNRYGWIYRVETWDDVTVASNLLSKARSRLEDLIKQNVTIELTAIDLSLMDQNIDNFKLGQYIHIISEPHNMNDRYMLKKQSIDLLNLSNNSIILGYTYSTFTDKTVNGSIGTTTESIIETVNKIESDYVSIEMVQESYRELDKKINATNVATNTITTIDPNITLEDIILTNHSNAPGGAFYIYTYFRLDKTLSSNRSQIAIPYNSDQGLYYRNYYNGAWSPWYASNKDTGWTNFDLNSGWSYYKEVNRPQYRIIDNVVHLRGVINATSSAPNVLGSLPDGVRPNTKERFICALNQLEQAVIIIEADGSLKDTSKNGSRSLLSLSGINYPI